MMMLHRMRTVSLNICHNSLSWYWYHFLFSYNGVVYRTICTFLSPLVIRYPPSHVLFSRNKHNNKLKSYTKFTLVILSYQILKKIWLTPSSVYEFIFTVKGFNFDLYNGLSKRSESKYNSIYLFDNPIG